MKKVFIETELTPIIDLNENDTHHILNVLRFNTNNELSVGNSKSETALYKFVKLEGKISKWTRISDVSINKLSSPIVLIQSFLKGDKFEYVLQKATELDIHEVIGVASKNIVAKYDEKRLIKKEERWNKIMREAAQQCGRSTLPNYVTVKNLVSLANYIDKLYPSAIKLVAYENEEKIHIKSILREYYHEANGPVVICIGPEGGFDISEIKFLNEHDFISVTLGNTILRAETAAISSVAMINYERS